MSWPRVKAFPFLIVGGLLAAALGIRLDELLKPFLWISVLAIAVSVMLSVFGTHGMTLKLLGWAGGLLAIIIGWPMAVAAVQGALSGQMGRDVRAFIVIVIIMSVIGSLLLLGVKIRALLPQRRPERPTFPTRQPILEPLNEPDEPWNSPGGVGPDFGDSDDDLGLFEGWPDER